MDLHRFSQVRIIRLHQVLQSSAIHTLVHAYGICIIHTHLSQLDTLHRQVPEVFLANRPRQSTKSIWKQTHIHTYTHTHVHQCFMGVESMREGDIFCGSVGSKHFMEKTFTECQTNPIIGFSTPIICGENYCVWLSNNEMFSPLIDSHSMYMYYMYISVLPSIHKACRPNKPSVWTFLWCGNGRSIIALMWPVAPPKICPSHHALKFAWGEHCIL